MIRPAEYDDLEAVLTVCRAAREFMAANGNPTQWGGAYPPRELLAEDIEKGRLYVEARDGAVHASFALIPGEDPTYRQIEGAWPDDAPYATIHRVASDGALRGVFGRCAAFCGKMGAQLHCERLRIDTHPDNALMRLLIERHGFVRCGIIRVRDGSPRIAYQRSIAD